MKTEAEASEDLAFIKKIMTESRQLFIEDGRYNIIWGLLSIAFTGLSYLFANLGIAHLIPYLWGIPFGGLGIGMNIYARFSMKKSARSLAGNFISAIWLCVTLLTFALVGNLAVSGRFALSPMMGLVSIALAVGFTLSAFVTQSKILGALAFPWWLGGILLPLSPGYTAPLFMAAMILLFQVIPGFIMLFRAARAKRMR
jgi:hypothetical protein